MIRDRHHPVLAGRNVVRQTRRSLLIVAAMAVGVGVLIFFLALGDGMHAQWIDAGVRLGDGHVAIERPRFHTSGLLEDRLDSADVDLARRAVASLAPTGWIAAAAPRLSVSALASSAASAVPVQAVGVDPTEETTLSLLPSKLVKGRFLTPDDRLGAVVGKGLADRLQLDLGSRLVLTAQGTGEVAEQLVRVVGVFSTGIREVDEGLVDLPLATAGRWLGVPGAATSYAIVLHDGRRAEAVAGRLRESLPPSLAALTWRQTSPELDAAVRVDDLGNYLFNAVLLSLVALAVLEALLVSVLHRGREFGLLRAMGLTSRGTALVVLAEGVLLAVVSGGLGLALGFGVSAILAHTGIDLSGALGDQMTVSGAIVSPIVHPAARLARAWQGVAVVLALGVLSSLYPMWQASRVDVATALQIDQ